MNCHKVYCQTQIQREATNSIICQKDHPLWLEFQFPYLSIVDRQPNFDGMTRYRQFSPDHGLGSTLSFDT